MSRVRSNNYDNSDEMYWNLEHEMRKAKSAKDRCKRRKTKSIRKGIEAYWDKHRFHQDGDSSYDNYRYQD